MSILNVEHLTHGFGDRAIFNDVSFRLLKGEHIGLIGANGEGKSTFMNIITGKLQPDEGKIEWAKRVRVGYLDQHTVLEKGMTIREVLSSAFNFLFEMEAQMNEICDKMGDCTPEELEEYMEELGTIQDLLTMHDFYMIDSKVEEVARALGLTAIGLVRELVGAGQIFGLQVMPNAYEPLTIFILAPGAFFVLAGLTAIQNKVRIEAAKKGKEIKEAKGCTGNCGNCENCEGSV